MKPLTIRALLTRVQGDAGSNRDNVEYISYLLSDGSYLQRLMREYEVERQVNRPTFNLFKLMRQHDVAEKDLPNASTPDERVFYAYVKTVYAMIKNGCLTDKEGGSICKNS